MVLDITYDRFKSLPESECVVPMSIKAEGKDILSFSAGEPDFGTPQVIKDAADKLVRRHPHIFGKIKVKGYRKVNGLLDWFYDKRAYFNHHSTQQQRDQWEKGIDIDSLTDKKPADHDVKERIRHDIDHYTHRDPSA